MTGSTGQVGSELCRYEWPTAVEIVSPCRTELDIADPLAVSSYFKKNEFAAVINPAAYTAVDRAETDDVTAWRVNAIAPAALAKATRHANIPLVQISTDYVFDGKKIGPYREDDPICPVSVYGASKAAGELAVRTGNPRHVILRTSWVYSAAGSNFVKTVIRLAADRPQIRVVDDQIGCPTAAVDIAAAAARIALSMVADPTTPNGIYHFSNSEPVSWHGFAQEILRHYARAGHKIPQLEPISTTEYPTPAKRPANSVFALSKIEQTYGIQARPWKSALAETFPEICDKAKILRECE
ncbi:dTDP-4-dehydrorhamnose reductase [Ensifer sp. ENS10]|uniref:dTDP-4-dehydrorhamnose reductase n=1 Tax=Ensifer sp. ENS10 TaxID=2769286 RepID=UPI00281210C1|nr:dTDP-4-dehydrorhamnose reductase [Ensifer sp. ENS10]